MTDLSSIRAWQPGDGVTCSRARQAPRDAPCGRPVAVYTTPAETVRYGGAFGTTTRRPIERTFTVCANHIPGDLTPGEASARARKAAAEALIVEHWGEYQALIEKCVADAQASRYEALPADVRALLANQD